MTVRYFAFGANLHPATLARRRIAPLRHASARLDGHRLVFDLPGVPVFEPAFANIRPADDHVWGVLYELSIADMHRLRSFEGAAYREVDVEVESEGDRVTARAFAVQQEHRPRRPSRRYLQVITEGAKHHALPDLWIDRLEAHRSAYVPGLHEAWNAAFSVVELVHRWLVAPTKRS